MTTGKAKDVDARGRTNQRRRTRKDLLQAASRLMKQGSKPSLEEIAAEAMVSRATVYRYFPNVEALHVEAALDVATPQVEELFSEESTADPVSRVERVDTALHDMILANEASLRVMLSHSLQRGVQGSNIGNAEIPARQNRRTPLIEAALKPARNQFTPANLKTLTHALSLIVGTEAMVVFKDVLQLTDAESRKVKRWAIRVLVDSAKR